jgi:vancomycin permeability regulator SanA
MDGMAVHLRSLARGATALATLGLIAAAASVGSNLWIARAERPFTFSAVAAVPARTFAIVPGSGADRRGPGPVLRARLEASLELYRAGRVKAILVSGRDTEKAPEATVMRAWLRERGVPAADVWTDGGGVRTRETMNRASAYYGVTDAVVCTQTVNMARSLYLARAAGIDAVGLALPASFHPSTRYLAGESLKTTLAFAESQLRARPTAPPAPVVAAR